MSYKEIPSLLNSCKNVAKAYHSSVNFARAIHEAQRKVRNAVMYWQDIKHDNQVQSRPEGERPWSILQDVTTRWNSQLLCMKSCLKSEGAIRAVLASEEFKTMKSLVGEIFRLLMMLTYGA